MDKELTMIELIVKVEAWGKERGLDKTDPRKQYIKLVEEVSELGTAINTGDKAAQEDAIGDIMVVLTIMCMQLGCINIEKCFFEYFDNHYHGYAGYDEVTGLKEAMEFEKKHCVSYFPIDSFVSLNYTSSNLGANLLVYTQREIEITLRIGEILCILIDISKLLGTRNIFNCYRLAYNEIKDRKGKTIDGVFIKEAEPSKALDVEFTERVNQLHEPCPACVGCTLDDGRPNNLRYPCINAYRCYLAPGEIENTKELVNEYLDVYYCPSCGRRLQD